MSERSILLGVTSDCSDAIDGRVFASIPLDRVELEHLKERCQCFAKAKLAYPELYETYEFDCQPEWYGTGRSEAYDDKSDQDKLQRLSYDAEPGEGGPFDESLCAELDRLDLQEINSLVVPTVELPSSGNLRTECVQLVMSLYSDGSDIVDLRLDLLPQAHRHRAADDGNQLRRHRPLAGRACPGRWSARHHFDFFLTHRSGTPSW